MTPDQRADALIAGQMLQVRHAEMDGELRMGRGCYHVWVIDLKDGKGSRIARTLANTNQRRRLLEIAKRSPGHAVCVPVQVEVSERIAATVNRDVGVIVATDPGDGYFWVVAPVLGGGAVLKFKHIDMEADDEGEAGTLD